MSHELTVFISYKSEEADAAAFVRDRLMEGGTVVVDAGDDAIQAVTSVKIEDGTVTYRADGNDIKCDGTIEVKEGAMTEKTK